MSLTVDEALKIHEAATRSAVESGLTYHEAREAILDLLSYQPRTRTPLSYEQLRAQTPPDWLFISGAARPDCLTVEHRPCGERHLVTCNQDDWSFIAECIAQHRCPS